MAQLDTWLRYPHAGRMLCAVPTIGENIRRLREAAGIGTQAALADALGVRPPQVSDWERDRYGAPDTKTLRRIARALGCTIDAIIEGTELDEDRPINGQTGQDIAQQKDQLDVQNREVLLGTQSAQRSKDRRGAHESGASEAAPPNPTPAASPSQRLVTNLSTILNAVEDLTAMALDLLDTSDHKETKVLIATQAKRARALRKSARRPNRPPRRKVG